MIPKTIVVCLNDVKRVEALLAVVAPLARRHEAHVIGLYVIPAIQVQPAVAVYMTAEMFDAQRTYFAERAKEVAATFNEWLRREALLGEWRQVDSLSPIVADAVVAHGRESDLIVIGQVNADDESGVELDFNARVIMEAGRPVLVVPYSGTFEDIGASVVIGWNASREAARAAFDSLGLIQENGKVFVLWANPQTEAEVAGNLPGAELASALARHGVNATAEAMPTGAVDAGTALLNRVSDHGSDLLVLGAYGHTRLREFVFGGVTRTVLENMTVPVLMTH